MKVWEIIRLIEDSPVRAERTGASLCDVVFSTPDGVTFEVFFDSGEPDYLNWLEQPPFPRIDFWQGDVQTHVTDTQVRAIAYLASNLIALPHVRDRLLLAAARLPDFAYAQPVQ